MIDKEAIAAIAASQAITAATHAIGAAAAAGDAVALPENFRLHDLEKLAPLRRRARGRMSTASLDDFAAYVLAHAEAGASVFVDSDAMTATAVLNLGTPTAPGHADNEAVLKPTRTAAYEALLGITNRSALPQRGVAEFFEDWLTLGTLQFAADDDAEIQPAVAIAAVRSITIEGARRVESIERSLGTERSAFESVQASSGPRAFPTRVRFSCIPYVGLDERAFDVRVGVLTSADKPMLSLHIVHLEQHAQEMADELTARVRAKFANPTNTLACLIGRYSPKE